MSSPQTSTRLGSIVTYARTRPLVSLLFVVLIGCGVASLAMPASAEVTGTIGVFLGTSASGIVFIRGSRKLLGRERLPWFGVGLALVSGALGVLVIAILSSSGADLPAFGPLDTFFFVSYVLIFVSIVALPHTAGRWSVRALAMVDGLVGAVALATIAWVWFLSGYLDLLASAPPGQRVIAMAYPILDVAVLISVLLLSVRRSNYWFDPRLLLLSIGLVFQVMADLTFASTGVGELFAEAKPIFALYIAAGIFLLAAASIVHLRPKPREFADRPTRWATLIAPYGAASAMVGALLWNSFHPDTGQVPLLVVATVTVVVLTFVRQAISIREYRYQGDEDRQNLVSSISHELRTPLTSMYGMLELLREGRVILSDDEKQEFLDTATGQARHMGRVVSDLILLARDRDDTIRVVPTPSQLDRLVREAVDRVDGSDIVDVQVPALMVDVDRDRLGHAISRLVDNAVKYGGGYVLVTVTKGSDITIEIHDNGPGVPTKYELVIWNRFERGPRKLDSRVPGSGNGLAIVAKVAKAHGGRAGYRRSEILDGACFFIVIPETRAPAPATAIHADAAHLVVAV
ncbi:MAG TPA: HAMP domain-containing sensor histidine kinase [Acidimicrobiia bacterium]|nr:HAMP domain-containing sensor histidine kinase [Acidimicrobiia bacterium]